MRMDMQQFFCASALLESGWQSNVLIDVDNDGIIVKIAYDTVPGSDAQRIEGHVIPSMVNLHSHAFQRAMAGLAEVAGGAQDSFWTWRETMYHLVANLTPPQVGAIARCLYIDMLKSGYTQVAEFHYLHHDQHGNRYQTDAMAQQLMQAAADTGIGQTLLPVLYSYSGFGAKPPAPAQRRFIQTADEYLRQLDNLRADPLLRSAQHNIGICFHSLRAVSAEQINLVLQAAPGAEPVHIHIAEQQKEVDDCITWCGQRPVEYLFNHTDIDKRWCLVHATHLDLHELTQLACSRAVVGICATTEANLGDGLFPAVDYIKHGGRFGVGSDSHVSVCPREELRWFEYGQRLRDEKRSRLVSPAQPNVAEFLWQQAASGGAQACGVQCGAIATGKRADWLVLIADHWFAGLDSTQLLNRWLFSGAPQSLAAVYVAGKKVVENGYHAQQELAYREFAEVMLALRLDS